MNKLTESRHLRRNQLDKSFTRTIIPRDLPNFKQGYISELRSSLGMSTYQLAQLLGVNQSTIARFEEAERKGTISLNSLKKIAEVMDCHLVYALVPNTSLEDFLQKRANAVATKLVKKTGHSMALENQSISAARNKKQIENLTSEIARTLDRDLWDD
jgi:predicted DNA-binding mobile mystery protein A